MTTEQMRGVLADLREGLVPLVAEATDNGADPMADPFRGEFPVEPSASWSRELIGELPFPEELLAARPDRASLRHLDRHAATSG